MAREYGQHLLLVFLDCVFLILWAVLLAGTRVALDWVIERIGLGPVDEVIRWCFEIAFGLVTFFWVVRTVWKVHSTTYHESWRRRRARRNHDNETHE